MEQSVKAALEILGLPLDMEGKREARLAAVLWGRMVGVANVANVGKHAATIYQLFVAKEARRQGIGTKLVQAAEGMARQAGGEAVSAIVVDGGPVEFWVRLGYAPVHHENGQTLFGKRLAV